LEEKLKEVLQSDHEDHLVCLSDTFENLDRYTRSAKRFWRTHFYLYGYLWDNYLKEDKVYYNTFLTRPYMDYKDKSRCGIWFESLKKIWDKRDIVLIEGQKSRLGYGNDLFSNANSIKRILCPPRDAFDCYGQILDAACDLDKNHLFLVALGPTATALAYDLYKKGYQAIDAGHVDIEYEWYRMGAQNKVPIPSKYVNESPGGDNTGSDLDEVYKNEVIRIIE
jgi:glycosyltransferase family protein